MYYIDVYLLMHSHTCIELLVDYLLIDYIIMSLMTYDTP